MNKYYGNTLVVCPEDNSISRAEREDIVSVDLSSLATKGICDFYYPFFTLYPITIIDFYTFSFIRYIEMNELYLYHKNFLMG
jgi:hypothetical protein